MQDCLFSRRNYAVHQTSLTTPGRLACQQIGDGATMYESDEESGRSALDVVETLALLGALALIAAPAVKGIARRWRIRYPRAMSEAAIDESLDETYPASDPPASRYVDIPENRK